MCCLSKLFETEDTFIVRQHEQAAPAGSAVWKAVCLLLESGEQATIAGGGVIPHIHKSLINKTQKKEII